MQKYLESIAVNCRCYIEEEIPKKIDNAIKKFAPDVDRASIIGFLYNSYGEWKEWMYFY